MKKFFIAGLTTIATVFTIAGSVSSQASTEASQKEISISAETTADDGFYRDNISMPEFKMVLTHIARTPEYLEAKKSYVGLGGGDEFPIKEDGTVYYYNNETPIHIGHLKEPLDQDIDLQQRTLIATVVLDSDVKMDFYTGYGITNETCHNIVGLSCLWLPSDFGRIHYLRIYKNSKVIFNKQLQVF